MIIGDVRGNGLDAVLLARHVLSAFRRSAVAAPALDHVAGEVSQAIKPHLGEEDLVTAALAQLAPGGSSPSSTAAITRRCCTTAAPCGRWPAGRLRCRLAWKMTSPRSPRAGGPGERLLLYTDGLVESRNQHGDFLPQDQIATALLAIGCDHTLDALMAAVNRHTGGRSRDDMALLLLEYGAYPHSSANGNPRPGPVKT